jgi:chemotaxis protein MotB
VSLSQNLLFKTNSDKIDNNGQLAIRTLAQVLTQNPDIEITVEGHTDSDGTADYNWDLSTARATSVVKLLASSGVDPKRITAAGRSMFQPVVENNSPENKSRNRRVDIILSPRLDQLFQIIRS